MQVGLGGVDKGLNIQVYIANRPPISPYDVLDDCKPMVNTEIAAIGQHTGNHWRKVFNVYAKLMFEFIQRAHGAMPEHPDLKIHFSALKDSATWQAYRDNHLLQLGSATGLLFTPPNFACFDSGARTIHIIMGKGYAQQLGFEYETPYLLADHHGDFAFYEQQGLILCPYFDYRQLSNAKISVVVDIMLSMLETKPQL